jgi:pimeloyl-ACP methyl ester carboxylesterase
VRHRQLPGGGHPSFLHESPSSAVKGIVMTSSSTGLPAPEGPGSVSGAPNLPQGFTATFTSRYIDTGELRQHVVSSGDGPPLLLVHGWPQTWYAWRLVMPALARDFTVIAPDQRGTGLSGKPADGYDTGTLAADLVALMDALGHQRFAVAGHDTGMWIGYALAADHPGRIDRLAVAETPLPGVSPSPPLFANAHLNNALWHQQRKERRLTLPILAIGGQYSLGEQIADTMKLAADDVQPLVVPACAHWIPEEAPEEMLAALTAFLAPYRG